MNAVPEEKLLFETMSAPHLPAVMVIEKDVFSDPWSLAAFQSEIANTKVSFARVALSSPDRLLIGYFVAWIVAGEVHLGNLAVAREAQGRGIGQRLLDHLVEEGRKRGCRMVTLEVRESNLVAQGLYLKNGFHPVAIRRRYYPDNREDAIVMMLDL